MDLPLCFQALITSDTRDLNYVKGILNQYSRLVISHIPYTTHYLRYKGFKLCEGYPKPIFQGFPGAPLYPEAVFSPNGEHILYIRRGKFWIFSPTLSPPTSNPKQLDYSLQGVKFIAGFKHVDENLYLLSETEYWIVQFNVTR
ncbi:uncharacterized protein LOC111716801 [Eurytemora carolleeae]|uniref:uncharacterized protein LOC111716801 n=1 Tax=Eurytemora carolleeae TaxID=1294199 RepID=UPI000C7653A6|nr:uncharacterized protein LOC111716801 [Eurytemora carolleeae]|eukprot:XP_023348053.1 uncharacterized protein LOC111716801 [Eurytemora affinis]